MTWFQSTRTRHGAVGLASALLGFLLAWPLLAAAQDKKDAPPDPAAKHAAMPADKELAEQIKLLIAKVARLEAALPQDPKGTPPAVPGKVDAAAGPDKSGAPAGYRIAAKYQNCLQCHQTRPSTPLPPSHLEKTADKAAPAMAGMPGMNDPPKPDGGMAGMANKPKPAGMGMMGMMGGKGMGMMDGMMGGMGSKKKPMAAGGDAMPMMDDDMDTMGGMGAKKPAMPMMGDDMDMMGMMGMGSMGGAKGKKMKMTSALPGFPGASHIYHIGASDFFLDHPQHITLSTEQETKLVKMKHAALTAKASGQRRVEEAEQQLWELTAADQPDAAKLESKVREVEKLRGDQRMAFIRSVGEAAQVLTDDQRKILIGQATTTTAPAAPPKTP